MYANTVNTNEKPLTQKSTNSQLLAKRALQVQRGGARAAVLGVNDGLVSILCLVLAVAAAGADNSEVLLAGFAGVIAGAVSMAAGEWISVRSQVELFQGVLKDLQRLIQSDKKLLVEQLENTLLETGYRPDVAKMAAQELSTNDQTLTNSYAAQVMGFNPNELGSPWISATSSFLLFVLGSAAPMVAWFFTDGFMGIWISIALTGLGSLIVGGYVATTSGKNVVAGALRQFGIVLMASAITYGIGYIFGVTVA